MVEIEEEISKRISDKLKNGGRAVVAIDGCCAAGKTTLADALSLRFCAPVVRMDDFFLRPIQRTAARYSEPGGNIDYERFCDEVLPKLKLGVPFRYRKFDCSKMALCGEVEICASNVVIVDGTYSCHEKFVGAYDLTVFLDIDKDVQRRRIIERDKDKAAAFFDKWIPLERAYFSAQRVAEKCDLVFKIK